MANTTTTTHHHHSEVIVVMVPMPAQGHLNQLLHLSRLITSYNIPVHYVSTEAFNEQARVRVHGWDPQKNSNLYFHNVSIPQFSPPPPNPNSTIKFPSHMQPLFDTVVSHFHQPFATLLDTLSGTARRVVIVHDMMMSSAVRHVADVPNAESYIFHSVSTFSVFWFFWEELKRPIPVDDEVLKHLPTLEDCFSPEFVGLLAHEEKYMDSCSGSLYNTCRVVEGDYMDLIEKMSEKENKKHWAIGPFHPVEVNEKSGPNVKLTDHDCVKWLNKQEPRSVVFVSFGTTTSLHEEQISELAKGLEQSGVKFIWVLRDADRGDNTTTNGKSHSLTPAHTLPKGFEERVRERGIVIRDWAPQLEILGHSSTGGFVSHCGWNSCIESISMGVPIAAWPMHSDQPRNATLITKVLKIGLVVKDWAKRNETVEAWKISDALKRLMGSEEGAEMRRRVAELSGKVRRAVEEGGVSRVEMDSFIAHISR